MLPFLSFLLLSIAAEAAAAPSPITNSSYSYSYAHKNIFILAGQSNMVGLGGVVNGTWDRVVPPECRPSRLILRLTANLTWVEAREPLHADIDAEHACGVGPGMPFANAVLRMGKKNSSFGAVGLVPCAVGGTSIGEWARGSKFYGELVKRAKASVKGGGGTIRALLWYQGESDTNRMNDAASYKQKFEKFVGDLRRDLQSPTLPVFQVALASGTGPFIETVREAQLGVDIPNVRCVDAKGLPLEPGSLHLSTAAQVRLGEMLAQAFLQSTNYPLPSPPTDPPTRNGAPTSFSYFVLGSVLGPLSRIFIPTLLSVLLVF
ncbi:probable carbohydrate esterase At4g34215 [Malania oleifera]|uniref:probable carbohydrate esterase At4g34215 n=1 Tax=Malania oleifera TaxID=397392 RepID=UPI0025AE7068|nr:probable carbohydrate esterase At4g34215 [Malania oleifera]